MRISQHFTLEELTASSTAKAKNIMNIPPAQQMLNLAGLVHNVLEPLRVGMGIPINISSGYRCTQLNKAVGGVSNSQHCTGEAADISIDGDIKKGANIFNYIKKHLPFDQLILEHNASGVYWVHVSYRTDGKNRQQPIENLLKE